MKFKKSSLTIVFGLTSLFTCSLVFGDYGTAHIKIGSITSGGIIEHWNSPSVAQFGYTQAVINASDDWDAVSTGVDLSSAGGLTPEENANLKIYVGNNDLPSGAWGSTDYWKYNWLGQATQIGAGEVTSGTDYEEARIRIDHDKTTESGFSTNNRYKLMGHEFGHVLGLNHFEDAPAHSGDNWMKSGQINLTDPTTTDKDHLKQKWGS